MPHENQGDCDARFQGDEAKFGRRWDDAFRDNGDPDAGFDVGENRADQTWSVRQARDNSGAPTSSQDSIVQSHSFATGQENERFRLEDVPRDGGLFGQGVIASNHHSEGFTPKERSLESERLMADDRAGDRGGQSPLRNHFPHALGRSLLEMQGDAWASATVGAQEAPQKSLSGWTDVAESEFAFLARAGALDALDALRQPLEEDRGLAEKY